MYTTVTTIRQSMDALKIPLADRNDYLTTALAKLIAYQLPLPSQPVDQTAMHYNTTCLEYVQHAVGGINESVAVNIEVTLQLTFKFWLLRYRMVHEPTYIAANALFNAVSSDDALTIPTLYSKVIKADGGNTIDSLISAIGNTLDKVVNRPSLTDLENGRGSL